MVNMMSRLTGKEFNYPEGVHSEREAEEIRRANQMLVDEEDRKKRETRRKIEDYKLAKELGISVNDLE